jgi:hypothetical protein
MTTSAAIASGVIVRFFSAELPAGFEERFGRLQGVNAELLSQLTTAIDQLADRWPAVRSVVNGIEDLSGIREKSP